MNIRYCNNDSFEGLDKVDNVFYYTIRPLFRYSSTSNMAKARIKMPDGTIVQIEGTAKEVAEMTGFISGGRHGITSATSSAKKEKKPNGPTSSNTKIHRGRTSPTALVEALIDSEFFKKPKDLSSVKGVLAEMGHIYPITTLSVIMVRLVRRRELRRIKQDNRWLYTH